MKVRQKWDFPILNNRIREDFFLLKFQRFFEFDMFYVEQYFAIFIWCADFQNF